jgi:anti-anti-sigma regulatory factor
MATNAVMLNVENGRVADVLNAARETLADSEGELVLDFSSVQRVNPADLKAIDALACAAGQKSVKVVLRGVNVELYKVLKLVRLASRFSFVN